MMRNRESRCKNMHWKTVLITWRDMQYILGGICVWNYTHRHVPHAGCCVAKFALRLPPRWHINCRFNLHGWYRMVTISKQHMLQNYHLLIMMWWIYQKTHLIGFQIPSKQWPIGLSLRGNEICSRFDWFWDLGLGLLEFQLHRHLDQLRCQKWEAFILDNKLYWKNMRFTLIHWGQ